MNPSTKALYFSVYLLCMNFTVASQDLLVNSGGDSVNVEIIEVDGELIHYSMPYSEDVFQYPVQKAKTYSRGFFVDGFSNVPAQNPEDSKLSPSPYSAHTTLRLHLNGGWSTLLGQISEDTPGQLQEYSEELRNGLNYSAGLDVFFHKYIGLGAQFTGFLTSNEISDYTVFDEESEEYITGVYAEKIDVYSFDFKLIGRYSFEEDRITFFTSIGGSLVTYANNANVLGVAFKLKSGTFGASAGMGLDFKVDRSFAIGIKANVLTGFLDEYEVQNSFGVRVADIEDDTYNNISRLDISLGLRWYW